MPAKHAKLIAWGPDVDALLWEAMESLPPRADGRPWSAAAVVRAALAALPETSQRLREKLARGETRKPGPETRGG